MAKKKPKKVNRNRDKKVKKEKKICLRCDKEFVSIDGNRMCNNCHDSNKNMAPMAEGY